MNSASIRKPSFGIRGNYLPLFRKINGIIFPAGRE
jgi:hypothetical protein